MDGGNNLSQFILMILFQSDPTSIPVEVTCYSVMLAITESVVLWLFVPLYLFMMADSCVIAGSSVIYIFHFIRVNKVMSAQTQRLQRMLTFSLVIQVCTIKGVVTKRAF